MGNNLHNSKEYITSNLATSAVPHTLWCCLGNNMVPLCSLKDLFNILHKMSFIIWCKLEFELIADELRLMIDSFISFMVTKRC